MTDPDDALAVRLQALWAAWDGPETSGWEAYFRLLDQYPGGAGGYVRDLEAAARRWVSGRASGASTSERRADEK